MRAPDLLPFWRAWLSHPSAVGAIAPSGAALARLITRDISNRSGPVLELGSGTGVFTRALIARGVEEADLTLVETAPDFARLLRARFPQAEVLAIDAAHLQDLAAGAGRSFGAVVSGLPLLNMSPRTVIAILAGAFGHLRPQGAFYQFTYGPRCPIRRPILDRLGLRATFIGRALLNVPPAAVYRISRRGPSPLSLS